MSDIRERLLEVKEFIEDIIEDLESPEPPALPAWYATATGELGVREIPGSQHNPRVLEYHATTGLSAKDDETPWCSSFVNWCIERVGLKGTDSAAARSWLKWGDALEQPRLGAVTVLWRVRPDSASGHVAFFVKKQGDTVHLLGGNQGNAVSIKPYPANRVLGYRWPAAT